MIPKRFECMGSTIRVVEVEFHDSAECIGHYSPDDRMIGIQKGLPPEIRRQTFMHELLHCILDHLNYEELNKDEQFVDTVAMLLYQYEKTQKGEL